MAVHCWSPKGLFGLVTPCEPVGLGWLMCRRTKGRKGYWDATSEFVVAAQLYPPLS